MAPSPIFSFKFFNMYDDIETQSLITKYNILFFLVCAYEVCFAWWRSTSPALLQAGSLWEHAREHLQSMCLGSVRGWFHQGGRYCLSKRQASGGPQHLNLRGCAPWGWGWCLEVPSSSAFPSGFSLPYVGLRELKDGGDLVCWASCQHYSQTDMMVRPAMILHHALPSCRTFPQNHYGIGGDFTLQRLLNSVFTLGIQRMSYA